MEVTNSCPAWKRKQFPKIRSEISGVGIKEHHSKRSLFVKTQDMLEKDYPSDTWIRAYTDGSAKDATTDGGGGIYIEWPDGESHKTSIPTGKFSSNFKAEAEALQEAVNILSKHDKTYNSKIVFLSDAKSVLQSLGNSKRADLNPLTKALMILCDSASKVVIQWVPGHANILGNEIADELAKEGGNMEQIHQGFSYNEAKTAITAALNKRWHENHQQFDRKDPIYKMPRSAQVIIFRLRTGHNRLRSHMFSRFKIGDNARCPCGHHRQDTEHILQHCNLLTMQRTQIWPTEVSLNMKLYGSYGELTRTTEFIRAAQIVI